MKTQIYVKYKDLRFVFRIHNEESDRVRWNAGDSKVQRKRKIFHTEKYLINEYVMSTWFQICWNILFIEAHAAAVNNHQFLFYIFALITHDSNCLSQEFRLAYFYPKSDSFPHKCISLSTFSSP